MGQISKTIVTSSLVHLHYFNLQVKSLNTNLCLASIDIICVHSWILATKDSIKPAPEWKMALALEQIC